MTRARFYNLPERARARSTARLLFRLFSRHTSGTQSFQENRHVSIHLLVVHNPFVPLIGRLVACSARTRGDRQTDRPSIYRNPRCACAPRVKRQTFFVRSSGSSRLLHYSADGKSIEYAGISSVLMYVQSTLLYLML